MRRAQIVSREIGRGKLEPPTDIVAQLLKDGPGPENLVSSALAGMGAIKGKLGELKALVDCEEMERDAIVSKTNELNQVVDHALTEVRNGRSKSDIPSFNKRLWDALCIMVSTNNLDRFKKRAAELIKDSPHPDEWLPNDFAPMKEVPALIDAFNIAYTRFPEAFDFPVPMSDSDENNFNL